MIDSLAQRDPIEQLAEEFMNRLRRGERPTISQFAAAHPDLAEEIRDLFPALVVMEEVKPAGTESHEVIAGPEVLPERLGDYRILREVARGGMGVVYEAEQMALGRHVALKVLPARPGDSPLRLLRFRREARSAARLHHTNIVPVFDVGAAEGSHYYAMQFIQGQGLDEVLQELRRLRSGTNPTDALTSDLTASIADGLRTGQFPATPTVPKGTSRQSESSAILTGPVSHYFRSVALLGVQAADALAYAHGQRVLHRDVKPSNLLLDRQGTLWLTDFGLAKDDTEDLTRTGDIVGTLRYMAPERFQGVSDPRSDVYALGVTLYEMLTLRPAFPELDRVQLISQIAKVDPPKPRTIDPTLPRDLETIVLKAIDKEPGRRYPTAAAMAEDLRRFLADRPILARRTSWREQGWRWCRRNPGVASALVAVVAILLVGVSISSWMAVRATKAEGVAKERLGKEIDANREARRQLFNAKVAESRASRFSRRPGQRFNSLAALTEATRLARELELGEEVLAGLRDDAIACLALPDVRPAPGWNPAKLPAGGKPSVDANLEHVARHEGDGVCAVRRIADGQLVARLPPPGPGRSIVSTLIGDGGAVAVCYTTPDRPADAVCVVWDWPTAKERFRLPMPITATARAFSPDGRNLAVGQADGTLTVHDAVTGKEERRAKVDGAIVLLAVNASGRVAIYRVGGVQVYDPAAGAVTFREPLTHANHLTWHPDGWMLAVGGPEDACVWDTHPSAAGRPAVIMRGHQRHIYNVDFSPDGGVLLTQSSDGTSRLWNPWLGTELLRFPAAVARFSRDGRWITGEQPVARYEVALGAEYRTLPGSPVGVRDGSGSVSGSGRWLALTGTGTRVHVWDLSTDKLLFRLNGFENPNFRGDDELIVRGAGGICRLPLQLDGDVLRVRPPTFVSIATAGLPQPDWFPRLQVSPGGRHMGVGGQPGFVADLTDPQRRTPLPGNTAQIAVSPDGRWAVSVRPVQDAALKVWRMPGVELVRTLYAGEKPGFVRAVFTPDGRQLLVTGRFVELWDVDSWVSLWRRETETTLAVGQGALSPDGRFLAAGLSQGTIHLLEMRTGRTLAKFEKPDDDPVGWLGFGMGGDRLVVTTLRSGIVRVWDIRRTREQLRELGLDWAPADPLPPPPAGRPVRVEFDPRLAEAGRLRGQARDHDKAGRQKEALAAYTQALERNPTLGDARSKRGALHAHRGDWPAAAADLLAVPVVATTDQGVHAAALHLLTADAAGYGRLRAEAAAAARKAATGSDGPQYDACRVCTLTTGGADAAEVAGWAEQILELTPSAWRLHVLARALLRAGKCEDAIKRAEQSLMAEPTWPGRPLNWLVLALAHHHLGRGDSARDGLARATTWRDELAKDAATGHPLCPVGLHLTDWLEIHVLLAETVRLIPRQAPK